MDFEKPVKKILDKKTALAKAEHYCAYQERSQQEVRNRLYDYGLRSDEVEELISDLIQNNFLNEERFARSYALGKFRMKQWGRIKIKMGLKAKKVSDKLIVKALKELDDDDYMDTLSAVLTKKAAQIREPDSFKRKNKLVQYGLMRGYENDLIFDVLKSNELL
ncbi:regulatory protein [Arcticibacter pallidicorallinus]|uniref:Regulatory protein RecX n=1 Tax=Arcticibacter pallidicorallinus TaxID=1259464 RepID=A0A2T0TQR8_9SPHI|nr:regulatory protein RecX [Arcticibacter pallidicorallinus]PRY48016.1 regulatory protein [Arcticibacter pallidicorallinus]